MTTPITVASLREMKQNHEKIACLTAYDASFATLLDMAGVEVQLVGDSLGMVIQGQESTLPVSIEEMIYHTRLVTRGSKRSLVIADLPFMSYVNPEKALETAGRMMKEGGAHMVKLEGGLHMTDVVKRLTEQSIPVCGHLGLLPQSVHKLGGYRVQGKTEKQAKSIYDSAIALETAGVDLLVLECVPIALAKKISQALTIPTIGIGAGVHCDGQVLVLYDMLGITPGKRPKFAHDFVGDGHTIPAALEAFVKAVKSSDFPTEHHSFSG